MIKSVNKDYAAANGTSLCGYINTTFAHLEAVLGAPIEGGDKTTAEWVIVFEDGTVATVYDWKLSSTPLGLYNWHVGGRDASAVDKVGDLLHLQESDRREI